MAAGVLMLIFSFLAFYKIGDEDTGIGDLSWSGWSTAVNLFPITTVAALLVALLAAQVAIARFANVDMPERIFGYSWADLRVLVGAIATIVMLSYALRSFSDATDGIGKGIGLWICLLSAAGFLVGSIMERNAAGADALADQTPQKAGPTPGDWVLIAAGVVLVVGSFLPAYSEDGDSLKSWDSPFFPLYLIPVLFGVIVAIHVAVTTFSGARVPGRVLGVDWGRIHLALGAWATFMMLGFLISHANFTVDDVEIEDPGKGAGFWLMLVGSIALVVGAVLRDREGSRPAAQQPPPAAAPPPPPPPPA